jgi:hypothetical protein
VDTALEGATVERVVGSGSGVVKTGTSDSTEVGVATGSSRVVSAAVVTSSVSVGSVVLVTGTSVVSLAVLDGRGVTGVSMGMSELMIVLDSSGGGSRVLDGISVLLGGWGVGVSGGSEVELTGTSEVAVDSSPALVEVSLTGGRSVVRSSMSPVLELDAEPSLSEADVEVAVAVASSVPLVVGSGSSSETMGSRSISFVELELELDAVLEAEEEESVGVPVGVFELPFSVSVSVSVVSVGSRPGILMPVGPMMIPPPLVVSSSSSSSVVVSRERPVDEVESLPSTPSRRSSSRPRRVEDWMVVVEAGSGSSSVVELAIWRLTARG